MWHFSQFLISSAPEVVSLPCLQLSAGYRLSYFCCFFWVKHFISPLTSLIKDIIVSLFLFTEWNDSNQKAIKVELNCFYTSSFSMTSWHEANISTRRRKEQSYCNSSAGLWDSQSRNMYSIWIQKSTAGTVNSPSANIDSDRQPSAVQTWRVEWVCLKSRLLVMANTRHSVRQQRFFSSLSACCFDLLLVLMLWVKTCPQMKVRSPFVLF